MLRHLPLLVFVASLPPSIKIPPILSLHNSIFRSDDEIIMENKTPIVRLIPLSHVFLHHHLRIRHFVLFSLLFPPKKSFTLHLVPLPSFICRGRDKRRKNVFRYNGAPCCWRQKEKKTFLALPFVNRGDVIRKAESKVE